MNANTLELQPHPQNQTGDEDKRSDTVLCVTTDASCVQQALTPITHTHAHTHAQTDRQTHTHTHTCTDTLLFQTMLNPVTRTHTRTHTHMHRHTHTHAQTHRCFKRRSIQSHARTHAHTYSPTPSHPQMVSRLVTHWTRVKQSGISYTNKAVPIRVQVTSLPTPPPQRAR